MKKKTFRSIYAPYIREFIDFKRCLGYKYDTEERSFMLLDKFIFEHANTCIGITKEIADKWFERRNNESDINKYHRLALLKQLSEYLRNLGFKSYIPQLPKYPDYTFIPYIYSYDEMNKMFKACDGLRLRQRKTDSSLLIMPCLLRMLYATGIRIGEALTLRNMDDKCLTIRETKNRKDRLVPITDTLADVCNEYIRNRNKLPINGIDKKDSFFFVSPIGLPCKSATVRLWFHKILVKSGISLAGHKQGPRVHDIRHSFACHSFIKLSDEGMNLYCSWPYLSMYLGHESLAMT